jgi:hypothetical protein
MLNNADLAKVIGALWDDFVSVSILFYAIAVYEGYKFSVFRRSNVSSATDKPL